MKMEIPEEQNIIAKHFYRIANELCLSNNYYISSYMARQILYHPNDSSPANRRWMYYPSLNTRPNILNLAIEHCRIDDGIITPGEFYYGSLNNDKFIPVLKGTVISDKVSKY